MSGFCSHLPKASKRKEPGPGTEAPCCVALGQPLPLSELPENGRLNPDRVETMLLPSYLPTFRQALAFSLIPEDPGLGGCGAQPRRPLHTEVGVPGLSCCCGRASELVEYGAILSLKCDFQCLCLTHALLGLNDKGLT